MSDEIYYIEYDGEIYGRFDDRKELDREVDLMRQNTFPGEPTECAIITYKISKTETVELSEE